MISDIDDPACKRPGSIIVVPSDGETTNRGKLMATVSDLENKPIYYIYTVDEIN
jgi:hypothetical protein